MIEINSAIKRIVEDTENAIKTFYRNWTIEGLEKAKEEILVGTTIVGVKYKDGIIIGSDRQGTLGFSRGADVQKIFIVDKFTVIGMAGMYAFCQWEVELFTSELRRWEKILDTKISMKGRKKILSRHLISSQPTMVPILGLGDYQGENFSLIRYDEIGAMIPVDYTAIGSGEPDAGPILREYNEKKALIKELDFESAKELVIDALQRAAKDNIGTGPKFDIVILDKDGALFEGGE